MDKIGSYGVYRNNYYEKPQASKNGTSAASGSKSTKSSEPKQVQLSDGAVKLLNELKKTYGNMDFIVADYETDEEAASYLSRGRAQYSVLITPDELEKMASDEDAKNENLKILDNAISKLDEMKKELGEKGQEVSRLGITIGKDGEVSYFAELEKVSAKQRERIEEKRESNREELKEEMKKQAKEPVKRTTVHASSVEELAEKIGNIDWSQIAEDTVTQGKRFDFTV